MNTSNTIFEITELDPKQRDKLVRRRRRILKGITDINRRPYGTGNIKQVKSGNWRGTIRINGIRHTKTFPTIEECKAYLQQYATRNDRNPDRPWEF
jgi:hypothetical protein